MPAMVFLGIVMMPFYYGSKVRPTRAPSREELAATEKGRPAAGALSRPVD